MEVHHHSHPQQSGHRKRWTHYFWEFVMLFLAVFCGFLAEYQLEHKIEKDRAKELAKSLYEELRNDSINAQNRIRNRMVQEKALLYLRSYFKDSNLAQTSKTFSINFMKGILFRSPSIFEPSTVVLEQLKNSGSLRYFKDQELQKLITELSIALHNVADRQALEQGVRENYLNPIIIQHYDYDYEMRLREYGKTDIFEALEQYESNSEIIPFRFQAIDKFDSGKAINVVTFYGLAAMESTRTVHMKRYVEVNAKLLKKLREAYGFKNL